MINSRRTTSTGVSNLGPLNWPQGNLLSFKQFSNMLGNYWNNKEIFR